MSPRAIIGDLWSKVNRFVISVVIASLAIVTYQIVIYIANVELKQQQQRELDFRTDVQWSIIENIINTSISKSQSNINDVVIPSIVNDINKEYGSNKDRLESDLDKLSDLTYENPVVKIMANNIRGKYFNNIKTDSNDMFVLMKNIGVISDLSISPSATVERTIDFEISQHFNRHLAQEAYNVIINQNYQKKYIFWQWFEPESSKVKQITEMKLETLKEVFKESGGDIESLKSFEFLVPEYIFVDRDVLGNPLVNDRGLRQNIFQFVVVQGFNVTEIIQSDKTLSAIFDNMKMEKFSKRYQTISMIYQIMIFIGLICLIYIAISTLKIKEKYNI